MAKGRIRSRMELREQYEAAEARDREGRAPAEGEDEDLGDLEEEAAEEAGEAEGEEEAAPVKKKPAKKKAATEAKPRKKTVKAVRKRVVWVVYDNSSKKVAQFDYTKKAEADAYAEKMKTEKKQTYFVQPFKEEIQD